ncbi:MAG: hypothetical protein ACRC33_03675, partial [Gemmataceae bacterium]
MDELIPWHKLFGMAWIDLFRGTPVVVEMEKDLSIQQQRLDVLILRREAGPLAFTLPDGFEDLGPHNLITYKSHHDALDAWALTELTGHFVAYRKLVSPTTDDLLPLTDFRLFAVCARSPALLRRQVTMTQMREGVYDVPYFLGAIRLLAVNELPLQEQNAVMCLFAGNRPVIEYGQAHHRIRSPEMSSLMDLLYRRYVMEGILMPDALEELHRQTVKRVLRESTIEERLEGIPPEKRLEGIPPEKRLEGIPPEQIAAALDKLSPEQL